MEYIPILRELAGEVFLLHYSFQPSYPHTVIAASRCYSVTKINVSNHRLLSKGSSTLQHALLSMYGKGVVVVVFNRQEDLAMYTGRYGSTITLTPKKSFGKLSKFLQPR